MTAIIPLTVVEMPTTVPTAGYSYVDALSDAGVRAPQIHDRVQSQPNTVYLWESGCQIKDGWNCNVACNDLPSAYDRVWKLSEESPFTLQNCLVYPIIATSAAEGWLTEDSASLLKKYGIVSNRTLETSKPREQPEAWPAMNDCTKKFCSFYFHGEDYCRHGPKYGQTKHSFGLSDALWSPTVYVDTQFCIRGYDTPNDDLGGSGVLASYIQQLFIAAIGWAFFAVPAIYLAARGLFTSNYERPSKKQAEVPKNDKEDRLTFATVRALADFQDTQIFFSITLQIASLVALDRAEKLTAATTSEVVMNKIVIKVIGATGIFPIILNLCALRRNRKSLDWFDLIAASCCVLLATVAWSRAMSGDVRPKELDDGEYQPSRECGGGNPMRYCLGDPAVDQAYDILAKRLSLSFLDEVFMSVPAIAVALLTLLALIATKFKHFRIDDSGNVEGDVFEWILSLAGPLWPFKTRPNGPEHILSLIAMVFELWLFLSNVMLLVGVALIMVPVETRQRHWAIGQIIAVAVWAPVIIKWLHLLYRGPENGSERQMPCGYSVGKKNCQDNRAITLRSGGNRLSNGQGDDAQEGSSWLDPENRLSRTSLMNADAILENGQNVGTHDETTMPDERTHRRLFKANTAPPV